MEDETYVTKISVLVAVASVYFASAFAAPAIGTDTFGPPAAVRQASPCSDTDVMRLCLRAVVITNTIHAKHGKGPVVVGPQAMLKQAEDSSKSMASSSQLRNQNLRKASAKVGCGISLYRSSVTSFFPVKPDLAMSIMTQWESDAGTLENIIGVDDGDWTAVGIFTDDTGNTWGTQTFGKGETNCPLVSGNGASIGTGGMTVA